MIKCLWRRLFSTSDIHGIMLDPRHTMHVTSEHMDWEEKSSKKNQQLFQCVKMRQKHCVMQEFWGCLSRP